MKWKPDQCPKQRTHAPAPAIDTTIPAPTPQQIRTMNNTLANYGEHNTTPPIWGFWSGAICTLALALGSVVVVVALVVEAILNVVVA